MTIDKPVLFVVLFLCAAAVAMPQILPPTPVVTGPVNIPTIDSPSVFTNLYAALVGNWLTAAQTVIAALFGLLALIDVTVYAVKLRLERHTMDSAVGAMTWKLLTVAFFFTLLTMGPIWMPEVIDLFIHIGRQGSGLPSLGPSQIMGRGVEISGQLLWAALQSAGDTDFLAAFAIVIAIVFVLLAFFMLTLQFMVAQVDIYIAVGIGQVMLGLGGSKWTVPYVERYFSFCVASGIKMMAMYILIGGGWAATASWAKISADNAFSLGSLMSGFIIALSAMFFAFVVYHCSKLVSSALGGSPAMSGSDFVAFMMPAATMAAGAAATVATGGMAAAAGAASSGMKAAAASSPASGSGQAPRVPAPMAAAAKTASLAVNAIRSMPPNGGHSSTPTSGIGH